MKTKKQNAVCLWATALISVFLFAVASTTTQAQAIQKPINSATGYASNIFDAEVQLRGWENAANLQDKTDLEFIYSHALGMISSVAKAHPEWLLEIEPMIESIKHPIIRRAMILGVSVSQSEESSELLKRWGAGEHSALVAELSTNGLAKMFVARPAQTPAMAVIYMAAFGATTGPMYVENIISGFADVLPQGQDPNPLLAEILNNYVILLANDKRGVAALVRLADANYSGIGEHLRDIIN